MMMKLRPNISVITININGLYWKIKKKMLVHVTKPSMLFVRDIMWFRIAENKRMDNSIPDKWKQYESRDSDFYIRYGRIQVQEH